MHEYEPSAESHLVVAASEQCRHLFERQVGSLLHHHPGLWHLESQELVALAIFPWCRLEEPHEVESLQLIAHRLHESDYVVCGGWHIFILFVRRCEDTKNGGKSKHNTPDFSDKCIG